jgi:ABC-type transporter Mla maintaining outer membrane lipid asymmetry permease subunit MlaE
MPVFVGELGGRAVSTLTYTRTAAMYWERPDNLSSEAAMIVGIVAAMTFVIAWMGWKGPYAIWDEPLSAWEAVRRVPRCVAMGVFIACFKIGFDGIRSGERPRNPNA